MKAMTLERLVEYIENRYKEHVESPPAKSQYLHNLRTGIMCELNAILQYVYDDGEEYDYECDADPEVQLFNRGEN